MRFSILLFLALAPSIASADTSVTSEDFEDLYDLVTELGAGGNSCSATGALNSNCQISCLPSQMASCTGSDSTVASCECLGTRAKASKQDFRQ
jgi:hypothetical protein